MSLRLKRRRVNVISFCTKLPLLSTSQSQKACASHQSLGNTGHLKRSNTRLEIISSTERNQRSRARRTHRLDIAHHLHSVKTTRFIRPVHSRTTVQIRDCTRSPPRSSFGLPRYPRSSSALTRIRVNVSVVYAHHLTASSGVRRVSEVNSNSDARAPSRRTI